MDYNLTIKDELINYLEKQPTNLSYAEELIK